MGPMGIQNATSTSAAASQELHALPTTSRLALARGLQADADKWRTSQTQHQSRILSAQGAILAGLFVLLLLIFTWRRCRRRGSEERTTVGSKRLRGNLVAETTAWLRHRRGSTNSTAIELEDMGRDETRRTQKPQEHETQSHT